MFQFTRNDVKDNCCVWIGYCRVSFLTDTIISPNGYNSGVYGGNCNAYTHFKYPNLIILTGYRGSGKVKRLPEYLIKGANNQYNEITNNYANYSEKLYQLYEEFFNKVFAGLKEENEKEYKKQAIKVQHEVQNALNQLSN